MKSFAETCRTNLLTLATAYSQAAGVGISEVSRRFYGRGNFIKALRDGAKPSMSLEKYGETMACLLAAWPAGADKPWLDPIVFVFPKRARAKNK